MLVILPASESTIIGVVQASDWSPGGTGNVTVDSIMALDIQEKVVSPALTGSFGNW